jgi:hypothetical protein
MQFFNIIKQRGAYVPDSLLYLYVVKLFNIILSTSRVTALLARIVLTLRQLQAQGSA